MAAPKGNQYAKGCKTSGRPRTLAPQPEECIALGEEMVKWVFENKPTHLSEWFSLEKWITWNVWDVMVRTKEFMPYYDVALSFVAKNIRHGGIDKSLAQRFLSLYHRDLKRHELDVKAEEIAIAAGKADVDQTTIANTLAVLDQLKKHQRVNDKKEAQEARKDAAKSNKTACKS